MAEAYCAILVDVAESFSNPHGPTEPVEVWKWRVEGSLPFVSMPFRLSAHVAPHGERIAMAWSLPLGGFYGMLLIRAFGGRHRIGMRFVTSLSPFGTLHSPVGTGGGYTRFTDLGRHGQISPGLPPIALPNRMESGQFKFAGQEIDCSPSEARRVFSRGDQCLFETYDAWRDADCGEGYRWITEWHARPATIADAALAALGVEAYCTMPWRQYGHSYW